MLSWKQMEREYIERLMTHCSGCVETAVRVSGMSYMTLYRKRKKYGIPITAQQRSESCRKAVQARLSKQKSDAETKLEKLLDSSDGSYIPYYEIKYVLQHRADLVSKYLVKIGNHYYFQNQHQLTRKRG